MSTRTKKINLNVLLRENIRNLVPYSSARAEFCGAEAILLDANENPFNYPFNRYPDPLQRNIKKKISGIFNLPESSIFLGNGSDEAIDLLFRAFCIPGTDNIISIDPSYGIYEVSAEINDIKIIKVSLNKDFSLNPGAIINAIDDQTKLIFLCSPNNPTSNLLDTGDILDIVKYFRGLVIVDEAYIDFSGSKGLIGYLNQYPNLVLLRTFSKAWALAGLRLGIALADPEIIEVLNKIKYPYNINILTQNYFMDNFDNFYKVGNWINEIIEQRDWLSLELMKFGFILEVYHSDANFLLVKTTDPHDLYNYLKDQGVIVRDRSRVNLCEGCLRITIGSKSENKKFLKALMAYKKKD